MLTMETLNRVQAVPGSDGMWNVEIDGVQIGTPVVWELALSMQLWLAETLSNPVEAGKLMLAVAGTQAGTTRQPAPNDSDQPVLWSLLAKIGQTFPATDVTYQLIADLVARQQASLEEYGRMLSANNGRNWRADLYQEKCDAAMYTEQGVLEGDITGAEIWVQDDLRSLYEIRRQLTDLGDI